MEPKQQTPSVIARLMGFDKLPPQQPVHKQQRVLSENYLRKTASIGVRERRSCHEGRSFGIDVEKWQEHKDAFVVPEMLKMDKHSILTVQKGKAKSGMTEAKLAFIRQKFTESNRFSMDEKLQHSEEFDEVLEELDSSNGFLLRYFQQSDSLFTEHLHDLQGAQSHCQSGEMTVIESSDAPNCTENIICRKSERTTAQGTHMKSLWKPENGFITDSSGELGFGYSDKLLKSRLELKDETCPPPTKILVLKPNFGMALSAARSFFLPNSHEGSQPGDKKNKELPNPKNGELYNEVRERKNLADDMGPSRCSFRVSRDFAKGISRHIRHSITSSSSEVSRSELRVDISSANESEVMMPSCPSFFDWKNRHQTLYSSSNGSSLAREAKKRFFERGKMTKSSQEVRVARRGNTLGEMLAMPDQETRPRNLNYKPDLNCVDVDLGGPFGISSKDGWKDEHVRNSRKFRALPVACFAIGNLKSRIRNEAPHNYWLRQEEAVTQGRNESMKQKFSQGENAKRESKFSCEKSLCFPGLNSDTIQETCVILDVLENKLLEDDPSEDNSVVKLSSCGVSCSDIEYNHTVQRTQVIQDELIHSFEENDQSEKSGKNSMVPNSSIGGAASAGIFPDIVAVAETENVELSSRIHVEQQSEPKGRILLEKDGHSPSCVLNASIGQESLIRSHEEALVLTNSPGIGPELSLNLGEGYSPSPNSVLEPLVIEEILSGSECFESVSSDLHGLRVQLQLLKSESEEANSEGLGMAVSSDEDSGEGSVDLSEENRKLLGLFRAEESRDFSYLVDVLDEAGYHGGNLEMDFASWHSSECLVHPSVFETLEKKYDKQTSWEKSERRLLFDRINSGLMEIIQPFMHMWEKPLRKRFTLSQSREVIEEELWMLLASQEKEASKDLADKALGTEIRWFDLRDDIDVIGREIERFLFDELAAEFFCITTKPTAYLSVLTLLFISATSGPVLDEQPLVPLIPPMASNPDEMPVTDATPVVTPAVTQANIGVTVATSATAAKAEPHHTLSFFMHDILGGSNPSAQAIAGIVTNPAVNGQVPFAKPNGAVLPVNNVNNEWNYQHQQHSIPYWP
ncbi:hypothetical protein F0562_026099 [Nyssa sinensis]|uniref:DUF4378 domain-containing protein n=1 Tax=Nyssa sinensis TaxID=561372 RepID=A0A5J5BCG1_9ASTE|nr:hypothetical protein F0562_026099 [Nyssa sinensis]